MYVEAPAAYVDAGATVHDTVEGSIPYTTTVYYETTNGGREIVASVNSRTLGTYLVVYSAVNQRGLRALSVTRTVVVRVTVPPIITLLGPNPLDQQGGTRYVDPGYTATSNYYGNMTSSVVVVGTHFNVFSPAGTRFSISYTLTDPSGNQAAGKIRNITIIDTIPPRLYLLGNATYFQQGNTSFIDPGCYANDTLDGDLTSKIVVTGSVNVDGPYDSHYTLTYNVRDAAGNAATPVTRLVIVINDIRPVIILNDGDHMTWESTIPFQDPGATAHDVLDGNITSLIVRTGVPDVMIPSGTSFVLSYNVRDSAGLNAVPKNRTVVMLDTIPPKITILGNVTYYLQGATPYVDEGAVAWDALNGNLTKLILVQNTVNSHAPAGTIFHVVYTVSDVAGNVARAYRTVIIIDTTPPHLYLLGNASMVWQGAVPWSDPGYYANDTLNGDLTGDVKVIGKVDVMSPAGTKFILEYTVQDASGNQARPLFRHVTIIDTIPPIITLFGNTTMWYESAVDWMDPGYYAFDTLDGNITSKVDITGTVDVWAPSGTPFELYYNVKDRAGNAAVERTRHVTMLDTIPPVITLKGASTMSHEGATPWVDPGWTAWDNLNGDLTNQVVVGGNPVNVMSPVGTTFTITYNVHDVAGNKAEERTREVYIVDTTPPVLTLNGPSLYIQEATYPFIDPGATAWDSLDGNLTARIRVLGTVDVYAPSGSEFTLRYEVTDLAGNNATVIFRTVKVVDTIPPNVTINGPAVITTQGGVPYVDMGAQSYDRLNGDLTAYIVDALMLTLPAGATQHSPMQPAHLALRGNMSILSTFAPLESTYTIEYLSKDVAGNVGRATRNVTIIDTLAPTIELLGATIVRLRQGSLYEDAGVLAMSPYFGDLSANVVATVFPGPNTLSNITSTVGQFSVVYSCSDPAGNVAVRVERVVDVLAPVSTAAEQAQQQSYSSVTMQFDMQLTTPAVNFVPVGYKASFVPYATTSNFSSMFDAAGVIVSYLSCDYTSDSMFPLCEFESPMLSFQDLDNLRALNMTASVSWLPLAIMNYIGSVQLSDAMMPTSTVVALLEQYNYRNISNIACSLGTCTFVSSTRGNTKSPTSGRRRRSAPELLSVSLLASPQPLMKRILSLKFAADTIALVNEASILSAVQVVRIQPMDIDCALYTCSISTYDPIQPYHVNLLKGLLPKGTAVQALVYYVDTMFSFPNPGNSPNPADVTTWVTAMAISSSIVPHQSSCNATWCQLWTYAVATDGHISSFGAQVNSALFSFSHLNYSAPPELMLGWYSGSVSIDRGASIGGAFLFANISDVANLTCLYSLAFNNALDCSYNVPHPLGSKQLFALLNYSGVLAASAPSAITLDSVLEAALKRAVGKTKVTSSI